MQATLVDGWRPSSRDYIDHDTLPVRCHIQRVDHRELCDITLDAIALSWTVQVTELGFAEPILDDDDRLDVYITNEYTEGGAYVAGEGGDANPSDGRMGQPSYMALDPSIPTDEFASYVAHEFNHVVQYSMDFVEPTLPVWEATATAAEAWTLDDYQIYGEWVADFQAYPWMGILGDSYILWDDYDVWSYHEYGAGIWILHLDETYFGGTGEGGAALWWALVQDSRTNEPDVLDAWGDVTGGTWSEALAGFVAFSLISHDADLRPAWVADADDGDWGSVPMETVSSAELPTVVVPEWGIAPTGWVHIELPDAPEDLVVSYEGDDSVEVVLVAVDADGNVQTADDWPVRLDATGAVELAIINMGAAEFDADDRLDMAPLEIALTVVPSGEEPDTGDPSDSGDPDDSDDGSPVVDEDPPEDSELDGSSADGDKGGCSATGTTASWAVLVGLLAVARRRQGKATPGR
jgi:uncharacterized protein (TIGR03382 family)